MATPAQTIQSQITSNSNLTTQDFHQELHKLTGKPADRYKTIHRGKQIIRKKISYEHSSNWSEASVNLQAKKIDVKVYLDFQQNNLTNADYQRLVQLARDGINRYWSRSINIKGTTFVVNTTAHQRKNDSIDADLYIETSGNYARSFNVGIFGIDASFIYNQGFYSPNTLRSDQDFKLVVAHEFGHSVLQYFGGEGLSWSHKGSTHIIPQSVKSSTPGYPTTGNIDLMKYYDRKKARVPFPTLLNNSAASEQDVMRLIWSSVITF
jgi:hypothetical protein